MKSIQSNIKKAKKYLDNNHCVAVPTETVYGLAANAYSNSAVKKIFSLKKRPLNNPLIVHYYNIQKLKEDCDINDNLTDYLVHPKKILIGASDGASDYGNKFGEPVISGFTRSFKLKIAGTLWEWTKPIMYSGGIGTLFHKDIEKEEYLDDDDYMWQVMMLNLHYRH